MAQFTYDHNGLRVKKAVNGITTDYVWNGNNIAHMTCGNDELHFFYDAQDRAAMVRYNGADYFYVYNLQGDVVALVDVNGVQVVEYVYDAWGNLISKSGSVVATLGTENPFRYRGYVYDEETKLYYNKGRYYNPECRRFICIDETSVVTLSATPLTCGNLYSYCSNNPIIRKDEDGDFWVQIGLGLLTQYAADVIENIIVGKTGWDILKPTSSIGEYIAAGVTAVIPGSGIVNNFVGNVVSEGIVVTEKIIKGEDVDFAESAVTIATNTAVDYAFDKTMDAMDDLMRKQEPVNYSSYAAQQRKKNKKITTEQVRKKMNKSITINRNVCKAVRNVGSMVKKVLMK